MAWKVTPGRDSSSLASLSISVSQGIFLLWGREPHDKYDYFMLSVAAMYTIICISTKWLLALRRAWILSSKCSVSVLFCFLTVHACATDPRAGWVTVHGDMQTRELTKTHVVCGTTKDDPKLDHPVTLWLYFEEPESQSRKQCPHPGSLACVLDHRVSPVTSCYWPLIINHPSQPPSLLATSCSFIKKKKHLPLTIPRFDINLK